MNCDSKITNTACKPVHSKARTQAAGFRLMQRAVSLLTKLTRPEDFLELFWFMKLFSIFKSMCPRKLCTRKWPNFFLMLLTKFWLNRKKKIHVNVISHTCLSNFKPPFTQLLHSFKKMYTTVYCDCVRTWHFTHSSDSLLSSLLWDLMNVSLKFTLLLSLFDLYQLLGEISGFWAAKCSGAGR